MLRDTPAPPGCANPYAIHEEGVDAAPDAAEIRARQLASYLGRRRDTARLLLIAEAPGYQGARFSGIAMTCERTLLGQKDGVPPHLVLRDGDSGRRTSSAAAARNGPETRGGFSEPTATVVWKELLRYGLTDAAVLWNVFPFHPRRQGQPLTNRTPSGKEVAATLHIIESLLATFQGCRLVCIGNTARDHLGPLRPGVEVIRHPANGGATLFRDGLRKITAQL
ncbi:uracil-DNA glycosylase [Palleronia rufa]